MSRRGGEEWVQEWATWFQCSGHYAFCCIKFLGLKLLEKFLGLIESIGHTLLKWQIKKFTLELAFLDLLET